MFSLYTVLSAKLRLPNSVYSKQDCTDSIFRTVRILKIYEKSSRSSSVVVLHLVEMDTNPDPPK